MKAPALIMLLAALLSISCTDNRLNGNYLVYTGTTSDYYSNPSYSHSKSRESKDLLVGSQFHLEFDDNVVIIKGYTKKKLILLEDSLYSKYNSANRHYHIFYQRNDIGTSLDLFTSGDTPDIKMKIRHQKEDVADNEFGSNKSYKFTEFSVNLKKIQ